MVYIPGGHWRGISKMAVAYASSSSTRYRMLHGPFRAVINVLGWTAFVATSASAQIQQLPQTVVDPRASDPAVIGWMQGNPPLPEKTIKFEDGSFGRFPQTRWAFVHYRELFPSSRVTRGNGPVSSLPVKLRSDLDAVTFVPLGGKKAMTWAQAFEDVYGVFVVRLFETVGGLD